ncbi:restriction endonuclease subunit S [Catenibacterium mitsuokai]|uniref:Restriction endonuclease subunit S n=2 Tax=Catenibacterium mitsuokai TaxID=100886 RepID=A0AAW4MXK0_9FIRM|nr:restriction endonuclease subunit S [Catenibacterium mitsuokai]MBV3370530.1 restriction endonuclease subunit S [Catenibacterium mitsuokai]MBV3380355.1 restriction endonuclease subunit S [Catenibacterium mitsuokai]MBV3382554.1 restriction endonuclease subunit S [Catenibacterium mitsuokai]MBV3390359.1 restriction endonuclease subunit S [Catenibacterium mitsuokai]
MEYVKLEEICTIVSGGTPSRSKPNYWNNGNIPWIKIKDMKSKYIDSAEEFITEEGLNNSSTKMLKSDTILYSIFATLGEVGILKIDACTNQAIAGLSLKEDSNILKEYLYYYLKSKKKDVNNLGRGVAQNNINLSLLRKFKIPVIPLRQQKRIIEVLDNVSSTINNYEREIDLLDELVKARFVEMFGDPVLNDKSWQVIKLGELCSKICSGNTPKGGSDNYKKEGIMFFRSQNVWKNRLELDDIVYIDEATHERMKETSLNYGDILITKTGRINTENSSLGRSALFLGKNDSANINGHVYLVRINSELVNRNFVLQILISPQYRDLIRRVCVGGIDKRQLNQNHIYDFPIIVPPLELQNQFASFVEEIDKSRSRIQKSLEASQELFDSLMQEYFG